LHGISKNKKAELAKRFIFGSTAVFLRPAAFRPLLTDGLALSEESHLLKKYSMMLSRGQILSIGKMGL
jgi:hypothetical protein